MHLVTNCWLFLSGNVIKILLVFNRSPYMDNIKCIGIDLAKEIFHLHAVDKNGVEIFKKKLSRKKLIEFMNNLDCDKGKTIIGM